MIILSHRGCWKTPDEKNRIVAFRRSFEKGFGMETDIRDLCGNLVISHDPPIGSEVTLDAFLNIYKEYKDSMLALNIKADGLQHMLKEMLDKYGVKKYFVFDMSVPDALQYVKEGFNTFTRQSEWEKKPSFYDESHGLWIDCFFNNWVTEDVILNHIKNGKKVCLVSPDLHKRDYLNFWKFLKRTSIINSENIMLCTDYPEEAQKYFNKKEEGI